MYLEKINFITLIWQIFCLIFLFVICWVVVYLLRNHSYSNKKRISKTMDMVWYGVDKQGNLAVFCNRSAKLPKFVLKNPNQSTLLSDYFETAPIISTYISSLSQSETNEKITTIFSDKGLYYFDSDNETSTDSCISHNCYTKQAPPQTPLKYQQLPKHIQRVLKGNLMNIEDFSLSDTIHIDL